MPIVLATAAGCAGTAETRMETDSVGANSSMPEAASHGGVSGLLVTGGQGGAQSPGGDARAASTEPLEGDPCNPTLGCAAGIPCVADDCDTAGVCAHDIMLDCTGESEPVCGCNGVTYRNACLLRGAPLAHDGECSEQVTRTPGSSLECVTAVDNSACCGIVAAVRRFQVDINRCLFEIGAEEPENELSAAACAPGCVTAACDPIESAPEYSAVAIEVNGVCGLQGL